MASPGVINRGAERRWVYRARNVKRIAVAETTIARLDKLYNDTEDAIDQEALMAMRVKLREIVTAWEGMA